jgi:glycosyltransferase involved in cell wall biosynthesis
VIVLAYDAAATIRRCLASLVAQDVADHFETVVVWSGDPATAEIVAAEFPAALLVGRPERLPTGAGRNLGIGESTGGVVVFLAADCRAAPDWLERRLAAHRAGFRCVGGAVLVAEPAGPLARASHLLEYSECLPGRPREVVRDRPLYNLSFHRDVFAEHGLYQADLAYGEDSLFNTRILRAGERFLFDPSIRIEHPGPTTLREYVTHQRRHGEAYARLMRDHGYDRTWRGWTLPFLLVLLGYPYARFRHVLGRILRFRRDLLRDVVWLTPLILVGIAAASAGLVRGWRQHQPHAWSSCVKGTASYFRGKTTDADVGRGRGALHAPGPGVAGSGPG